MIHICHYTYIQTHRTYNIRVNSKVTSRLWLIMMCQYKLILGKKCTILMSFSPSCLIVSSCLMHVKLSIQPEMQGKPDIDFWATSLYNYLCSKSLSCKVQPVSQSSSLIFVSSTHQDHCSVFGLHLSIFGEPPGLKLTQPWNSPHMFLFIQGSHLWAVCCPLSERKFFIYCKYRITFTYGGR